MTDDLSAGQRAIALRTYVRRLQARADIDASRRRDLADLQCHEMVALLFGEHRQQRQFARAGQLSSKVAVERFGIAVIACLLEPPDRVDRFAALKTLAVGRARFRI